MDNYFIFDPIVISVPKESIFRRLGYQEGITQFKPGQKEDAQQYIEDALPLIELRGAARRVPVLAKEGPKITLANDIVFESRNLSAFLEECEEIVLMAATAGSKILEAIQKESTGKSMARAVVFDAAASEMVDASLDWMMEYFNQQLRRENMHLIQRRFSAGYGDFLLSNQKIICEALELDTLGVTLTDNFILVPEKSVTAIAGIRRR